MNDDSGAVDDRLKFAGAKFVERNRGQEPIIDSNSGTDRCVRISESSCRIRSTRAAAANHSGPAHRGSSRRPESAVARASLIRLCISMDHCDGVERFFRSPPLESCRLSQKLSTLSNFDSANAKEQSAAGLRVGQQNSARWIVFFQSVDRCCVLDFAGVPPGTQPRSIKSKISSLITGTAAGSISALDALARHNEAR